MAYSRPKSALADKEILLNAPPKMVYRSTFTHQVKKIYGKIDVTKPIDWSLLP